jgi:hypothetical protein
MYYIPMITTGYFFQNFHLYDKSMLSKFFLENLFSTLIYIEKF